MRRKPGALIPIENSILAAAIQLRKQGIEIVDLFQVFAEARRFGNRTDLYLTQDSHWSPQGVQLAAKAVAERILSLGWAKKETNLYETTQMTVTRYGDVLRMVRVPQIENLLVPEQIECQQVTDHATGKAYQDDPSSEILVIGDSFLRIYQQDEPGSAGFIAQLACELSTPVTSIVNDGGASTLVRQQLARRPDLLKGKTIVLWEFVERDIRFGTEGWQIIPLP